MNRWVLYGTAACHLCVQAEVLLAQSGVVYDRIDITIDPRLLERYGTRIPVLFDRATGRELEWPFESRGLQAFVTMEETS